MRVGPVALAILLLAFTVPTGDAQTPEHLEVVGLAGCSDDRMFCFEITQGSLDDLTPGAVVNVTLINNGNAVHDVYFASFERRDPTHRDTPAQEAFANSPHVQKGARHSFNVTVPSDTGEIYAWCDVSGHEYVGMWLSNSTASTGAPGSPAPSLLLMLAAVVGVGLLRRGA